MKFLHENKNYDRCSALQAQCTGFSTDMLSKISVETKCYILSISVGEKKRKWALQKM